MNKTSTDGAADSMGCRARSWEFCWAAIRAATGSTQPAPNGSQRRSTNWPARQVEVPWWSAACARPPRHWRQSKKRLNVPGQVHGWAHQAPKPYAALLRLADALLVTGDSVSMLAEACHSRKPVAMLDVDERRRTLLNRTLRALTQ